MTNLYDFLMFLIVSIYNMALVAFVAWALWNGGSGWWILLLIFNGSTRTKEAEHERE